MTNLEVYFLRTGPIIEQSNLGCLCERHVPVAVPPSVLAQTERKGTISIGARRCAEEIPKRHPDARILFAIPIDLDNKLTQKVPVSRRDGQIEFGAQRRNRARPF